MPSHEHTKRCYWDYVEARWACRPELDEPALVGAVPSVEPATEPDGATSDG